jgi:hypothetical protein
LVDQVSLVRPFLCLFFPIFVTKRLVATATTDECGNFQTFFSRGCNNPDTPDLYFKAKQRLFGFFPVTIYEPTPVACYTHWDYACETEVTLYTTSFPTNELAPAAEHGKYQLKVDLFDENGNLVDIAPHDSAAHPGGKNIKYRIPAVTDLSGDIDTDDAATLGLVIDDDDDGKGSFIMTLHIDNNVCSASIAAPTLGGTPADPTCGVLRYDPAAAGSVTMQYTASHPNGFATRSFVVVRGVNPVVSESGPVGMGSFSITETVSTLLGGCDVAGFSENLYVAAMATDGWARLSQYDRSAVRAFVLAPEEEVF